MVWGGTDMKSAKEMFDFEEQFPDMRDKIKEYINELESEIRRLEERYEDVSINFSNPYPSLSLQIKIDTLNDVVNDLNSRLQEVI